MKIRRRWTNILGGKMLTEITGFTGDTNDIDYDAEICEDVEKK
jgi:hypothetical protein